MRLLYLAAGLGFVAIGGVGVIVPGLPTTVFFIMAAWCFSRSSRRLENWVLNLPGIGPMVRDYRSGLGMPRRAKVAAISCIVLAVGLSAGL
ncbi:MAG: YbaN family protein, partial [Actinomycetota bacterium]